MPRTTATAARYETLQGAADRLGVSTKTLRRRIAAGELRAYRCGNRIIRLRAEDVDALMRTFPNYN